MEEARVRWDERSTTSFIEPRAAGAPDAPEPSARGRASPHGSYDPATGPDVNWFTHEMHVPSSVRLNQLFAGGGSAEPSPTRH